MAIGFVLAMGIIAIIASVAVSVALQISRALYNHFTLTVQISRALYNYFTHTGWLAPLINSSSSSSYIYIDRVCDLLVNFISWHVLI
ncbi:unnamed protein product [Camellia sinensis]